MESAFMFVEKWVETPSEEQESHLGQLKRMVAERDAAIRKECADKEAQLLDAAKAFQELATCYRIGKRPTEKLFARLEKANAAIMGYGEKGEER